MKNSFLILFFISFYFSSFAQGNVESISQLKESLKIKTIDTSKVSISIKIAQQYKTLKKYDSSLFYFNEAIVLAEKSYSQTHKAKSYKELAINYYEVNNCAKALKNFQEAIVIYEKLENNKEIARLYNYIGICYSNLFSEDKAIQYYLKSLKIYENQLNDLEGVARNYIDIGNLYYNKENYEFAFKYLNDALHLYEKQGDKSGIAASYTNLGNVLADNNNVGKGIEYYFKSIKIGIEIGDDIGVAMNYNNLGDSYITLKQYKEADSYFQKALIIATKENNIYLKALVYLNMADLYYKENKINDAITKSYQSLELSNQIGNLEYQSFNLLYLSKAYEKLGNIEKSFTFLKQYNALNDSIAETNKIKNVELFHALNDLENKRTTIDELSAKHELTEIKYENEKKISYFLIILMAIVGLFLIISINLHTSRKKAYNLLEFRNHQIKSMNEEIQKQSVNLKHSNSTKDKFFSIIAHDLKNPFNSIQGFTELLIDNYKVFNDEKKLKFLKIIKASSLKASNLLANLLLWANNQSGMLQFNPVKIDLALFVAEAISFVEIQAINKEITIINNVDSNVFVLADKNMVDTVLRNLISNAIKFTYSKGEIQIYAVLKDNFIEICVKDNGIGIANDDLENLFNIDIKNTSVGTANEQGSGLGLILCKDFIEKNGGKIWVESKPNFGSEFKFTLPNYSN